MTVPLRCKPLSLQGGPFGIFTGFGTGAPVAPGVQARGPREWAIRDFIADDMGVDEETTSSIAMYNDKDTVTLIDPYEGVTVYFQVKIVHQKRKHFQSRPYSTKTYTRDVVLTTGQAHTVTVEEGWQHVRGGTDIMHKRDIYVTLIRVDVEDLKGEKQTEYALPGYRSGVFGAFQAFDTLRPQAIIGRVRERRAVLGELGTQSGNRAVPKRVIPCPARRQNIIDMAARGKVASPRHAGMIYAADVFEDTKANVRGGLRPY